MVNLVFVTVATFIAKLSNLHQATRLSYRGVVIPHVGRHIGSLRVFTLTILVVELIVMVYKAIVCYLSFKDMIGYKVVDGKKVRFARKSGDVID